MKYSWATSWEILFCHHANNKGADQPAHQRSLTSAFVIRLLDSIIPLVAEQAGLSLTWSQPPKTGFSWRGSSYVYCLSFRSSGFNDDLLYAAAMLYKATEDQMYLTDAENKYVEFGVDYWTSWAFDWSDKLMGAKVLTYILFETG